MVHGRGTQRVDEAKIVEAVREVFPLTPKGMIEHLDLRRPIYQQTAAYGHFGRDGLPWEDTRLADDVRRFLDLSEADMPAGEATATS